MSSTLQQTQYTPEDLLELPDCDRYELVDGQLLERKMGSESSWIAGQLFFLLRVFVEKTDLGFVWPSDNGFCCFPDDPKKVRRPDASFIRSDRLPNGRPAIGFETVAPDLAVEVVSPNDLHPEIEQKVEEYLQAGVQLVWVVAPNTRTVTIYRADGSTARLHESDQLMGDDVVPGFQCQVTEIFPPAADEK